MTSLNMDAVTTIIQEVADKYILPRFKNLADNDIAFKIGDDPVTIADKEAEKELSIRLSALLPGSKVLGEEAFAVDSGISEYLLSESPVWIIDPIDGTRNFVRGSSEFGVIVALAKQNQIIAGWIYDPTSKEVISAQKGAGAYYQGKKLKVLPAVSLAEMDGYLGDRLVESYNKSNKFKSIHPSFNLMSAGAHEYPCLVLNQPHFGKNKPQKHFRASLYYSYPWDDAAGVLIHKESGGYSSFWDGRPYQPSIMQHGFALAPDKDSWHHLKDWCMTFANLSAGQNL